MGVGFKNSVVHLLIRLPHLTQPWEYSHLLLFVRHSSQSSASSIDTFRIYAFDLVHPQTSRTILFPFSVRSFDCVAYRKRPSSLQADKTYDALLQKMNSVLRFPHIFELTNLNVPTSTCTDLLRIYLRFSPNLTSGEEPDQHLSIWGQERTAMFIWQISFESIQWRSDIWSW